MTKKDLSIKKTAFSLNSEPIVDSELKQLKPTYHPKSKKLGELM